MKKISFIIALVIVTSLGLTAVFALNSATTGRMIDNYKTRHEKILFESLPFTATGANEVLEHEYRMNGLEALKTRLAEVEKYYAEKKQETTIERMTLEKKNLSTTQKIKSRKNKAKFKRLITRASNSRKKSLLTAKLFSIIWRICILRGI